MTAIPNELTISEFVDEKNSINAVSEGPGKKRKKGFINTFNKNLFHHYWPSKTQYLLATIGYVVGLGNAVNFPALMYNNGGVVFLIPYILVLCTIGFPLFYMEVALGQFSSRSAFEAFNCVPILKGVGLATVYTSMLVSVFYNVQLTHILHFFIDSFSDFLPWIHCNHTDSKPTCSLNEKETLQKNGSCESSGPNCSKITPGENYWKHVVLGQSPSIEMTGIIKVDLMFELMIVWTIVCLCIIKGLHSLGKIAHVTTFCQYVGFLILFTHSITYEGAWSGIGELFRPQWEKVFTLKIWWTCVHHVIFSLSACSGATVTLSSFNRFNNNCFRDCVKVVAIDFFSSLLIGITMFASLGHLSRSKQIAVSDLVTDDFTLAFVIYPYSLTLLSAAKSMSSLYFFVLFALGLDSMLIPHGQWHRFRGMRITFLNIYAAFFLTVLLCLFLSSKEHKQKHFFVNIETIVITLTDGYLVYTLGYKKIITFGVCATFFCLGLNLITEAGIYWVLLLSRYGGISVIFVGAFEAIAIGIVYGGDRFSEDIELMQGKKPHALWILSWKYITPFAVTFSAFMCFFDLVPLSYEGKLLPFWANGVGWLIVLSVVMAIPIWAGYELYKRKGTFRDRLRDASQPNQIWRPLLNKDCTGRYKSKMRKNEKNKSKSVFDIGIQNGNKPSSADAPQFVNENDDLRYMPTIFADEYEFLDGNTDRIFLKRSSRKFSKNLNLDSDHEIDKNSNTRLDKNIHDDTYDNLVDQNSTSV